LTVNDNCALANLFFAVDLGLWADFGCFNGGCWSLIAKNIVVTLRVTLTFLSLELYLIELFVVTKHSIIFC
jgi:hypothetical protein